MAEPPTYTMFEIAAGTGMLGQGVSIALDTLGIRTDVVGGCEWESCAAAAFLAGLEIETGRRPAVWDDATSFVGRRHRCPGTGSGVDIVAAGYPCQPFSSAGKRGGGKDARHLWPACRRIVARLKPSIVFFENVDGHVSMGLWKVVRDCERLGYRTTAGVFSSEEVGAPHLRKRVFVLGLADPNIGPIKAEQWHRDEFARRSPTVGNATGPRRDATWAWATAERKGGKRLSGEGCDAVGDAERPGARAGESVGQGEAGGGRRGHADAGEKLAQRASGGQRACGEPPKRYGQLDGGDGELADSIGARPQRRQPAPCQPGHAGPTAECGGEVDRPIFPPGRDDYQRWAELAAGGLDPALMPAIESGVSALVDGNAASSSDLLRLGGNAVNPVQAGWAFVNLFACLLDPVESPSDGAPANDDEDACEC